MSGTKTHFGGGRRLSFFRASLAAEDLFLRRGHSDAGAAAALGRGEQQA